MLSCLNSSPLFIWTEPINIEALFSLAIKIRIGHIFHCQQFPLHTKTCVGHTQKHMHAWIQMHAQPHRHMRACKKTRAVYAVFLPNLIPFNSFASLEGDSPKTSLVVFRHSRELVAAVSRDDTIRWLLCELLALECFWHGTFSRLWCTRDIAGQVVQKDVIQLWQNQFG